MTELSDRELDALIWKHFLGIGPKRVFYEEWDKKQEVPYYIPSGKPRRTHMIDAKPLACPSVSIPAAIQLAERVMKTTEWKDCSFDSRNGWWSVEFYKPSYEAQGFDKSLARAICLASLKTLPALAALGAG